jgi:hypothetical protein
LRAYAFGIPEIDYFVTVVRNQVEEIKSASASAEVCATGIEQTIDYAFQRSMNL